MAVEAGTETRVSVEAKDEVRYWDLRILTVILNKVKAESNVWKRAMVGAKEDTNEKAERSGVEVEAEEGRRRRKNRMHYRTWSRPRWNIGRVRREP